MVAIIHTRNQITGIQIIMEITRIITILVTTIMDILTMVTIILTQLNLVIITIRIHRI